MQYSLLGNTGVTVSNICFGCMTFGSSQWRPWVLDEAAAEPFFKLAIESGINFFDTADMYSLGASEEITGKWLKKYANRDEIVLATKVHYPMSDKPNMSGLSRKHIQQACEASLKRLGVDVIDLYQIHRLDPNTPIEETLYALNLLVEQGKVRYLGASSMYAWEFMRALTISERNGWARFSTMQNHYNLIYREEEREMLPLCLDQGIGVMPWSPLARGMLAGTRKALGDNSTLRSNTDAFDQKLYNETSDWDVVAAVKTVAEQRGEKPAQVALAWLHAQDAVTSPIIGASKLYQLEDAIASVNISLSEDEIKQLEAPYQAHSVKGLAPGQLKR
jgi:1-deoxyxylulose-5-phosphate synthase